MTRMCVCMHAKLFSYIRLFVTLWTIAHQASLSMGFSRQEYWSGLPCPPLGDLPDPGIKPMSLVFPALASKLFTTSTTWEAQKNRQNQSTKVEVRIILTFRRYRLGKGMRMISGCLKMSYHDRHDYYIRILIYIYCMYILLNKKLNK